MIVRRWLLMKSWRICSASCARPSFVLTSTNSGADSSGVKGIIGIVDSEVADFVPTSAVRSLSALFSYEAKKDLKI